MGFLDSLKKNLGFARKDTQDASERAAPAGRDARAAADAQAVGGPPKTHPGPVGIDASLDDALMPEAESVTPAPATASADAAAAEAAAADALQQAAAHQAAAHQAAAEHAAAQQLAAERAASRQQAAGAAAERQAAAEPAPAREVVVEPGDTISGIALRHGVDVNALIAANAGTVPNPDHIYPGQVLRLP